MLAKLKRPTLQEGTSSEQAGYENQESLRKAAYKTKKVMPSTREKKVEVIQRLVTHATPQTKKMLRDRLIVSPNCKKQLAFATAPSEVENGLHATMTDLKKKRNKKALQMKRTIICSVGLSVVKKYSVRQAKRAFNLGHKQLKKIKSASCESDLHMRKKRKDALGDELNGIIQAFYRRPDISRALPDAKGVKRRRNGKLVSRSVMEHSLSSAYELFRAEQGDKVSQSTFAKLKPDDVLPSTSCRKRDCLCEYCARPGYLTFSA